MTNEIVILVAEIVFWGGLLISSPMLFRFSYQVVRYLRLKYEVRSHLSIFDSEGNELVLVLKSKDKKKNRTKINELLRKSVDDAKQSHV
ncbi:hypothetical protein DS891_23845 [Pseudoalteromonas sp. JC28]|uniref:hypothetical protein n=1 Tax=Pseudoalteromonas sp. JC28 TaxID=2267617 RepID=UPI0015738C98|nr:hypothetical protein [Pseudoalteromonas sp. JC28]NSY36522.1 hypothetical protein [Pseudoalteromonas sp. JC28]